jgi:hypothetical protein
MLFIKNGIWILLISNIILLYSIVKMGCLKGEEYKCKV